MTAPLCAHCKVRPQLAVDVLGEMQFVGRCAPCADAFAAGHARWREEREARQRRQGELARRERDGMPAVLPRVPRLGGTR